MRGIVAIVLLLLAFETAFCSTYAPIPTGPAHKTVTVQSHTFEFYKKKKQEPLRKKKDFASPVHAQSDDSSENKAGGGEEVAPFQSGDRLFSHLSFASLSGQNTLRWADIQRRWKGCVLTPDSPPPQLTV